MSSKKIKDNNSQQKKTTINKSFVVVSSSSSSATTRWHHSRPSLVLLDSWLLLLLVGCCCRLQQTRDLQDYRDVLAVVIIRLLALVAVVASCHFWFVAVVYIATINQNPAILSLGDLVCSLLLLRSLCSQALLGPAVTLQSKLGHCHSITDLDILQSAVIKCRFLRN